MNIQPFGGFTATSYDERIPAAQSVATQATKRDQAAAVDAVSSVKQANEPSREELVDAVDKINQSMPPASQSLEFSIDEDSQQTVVKVVDIQTREVVRQMPTEEALQIAKSLDQALGKLIKETA